MTESEWLTSTDLRAMLKGVRGPGKGIQRKLRLFASACCRWGWQWLGDERSRQAVDVAERHADVLVTRTELMAAYTSAREVVATPSVWHGINYAAHVAFWPGPEAAWWAATSLIRIIKAGQQEVAQEAARQARARGIGGKEVGHLAGQAVRASVALAQAELCTLLRCIMGNPCQTSPALPASLLDWQEGLIVRMANDIYDNRVIPSGHLDPARVSVLCDALLDAGCPEDHEVLLHLRGPGPHLRGCFALGLLTGRE
jgi:hypothetical protein